MSRRAVFWTVLLVAGVIVLAVGSFMTLRAPPVGVLGSVESQAPPQSSERETEGVSEQASTSDAPDAGASDPYPGDQAYPDYGAVDQSPAANPDTADTADNPDNPDAADNPDTATDSGEEPAQVPQHSCEALGVVGDDRECSQIEDIILGLRTAPLSYNKPETMVRGDKTPITLIVDLSGNADTQQEFSGLAGRIVESETKVARHMSAELYGWAFTIEPRGPQRKLITATSPTRWRWTVTPTKHGEGQLLVLDVLAHVERNGAVSDPVSVRTFRDRIYVDVTTWDRVKDFVQEVNPVYGFGTAVVVAAAGAYGWVRRKKKKKTVRFPKAPS